MSARVKRGARSLLAATLLLGSGCSALKAHVAAHRTVTGLYAIEGYQARTREEGLVRADPEAEVVRAITYGKLWKVRAEVVEPAEHAGELFVFDGETITAWWPEFCFGLRIRGVEVPPRREVGDAILESSLWAFARYDFADRGTGTQAGRSVQRWDATPIPGAATRYPYPYQVWLDRRYQVPLKLRARDAQGKAWYALAFEEVDFDARPAEDAFAFEFPPGAIVHEWDLADPGVSLEEARAQVEFPVLVPERLPRGHTLEKVIVSRDAEAQRVALLMPRGARWLSLSELPNMGPILVPKLGIPVRVGEREGVLNFALGFTLVSWAVDTTALTLIGNLPWPEMLEVAASVGPAAAEAK